jgi:hypothetical protein
MAQSCRTCVGEGKIKERGNMMHIQAGGVIDSTMQSKMSNTENHPI